MRDRTPSSRSIFLIALALASLAPSAPWAQPAPAPTLAAPRIDGGEAQRVRVTELLHAVEALPPREAFEAAASRPQVVLWEVAESERRGRLGASALDALARYWPSARALAWIEAAATDPTLGLHVRVEYVAILGRAEMGDAPVAPLAGLLGGEELQMQLTAATALGQMGSPRALDALRRALDAPGTHRLARARIEAMLPEPDTSTNR